MTTFGQRLRQLREERNISISFLAQMIGFRRETVSAWERGKAAPKSLETITLLAKFFGIAPETFFRDTDMNLSEEVRQLREEVADLRRQIEGDSAD